MFKRSVLIFWLFLQFTCRLILQLVQDIAIGAELFGSIAGPVKSDTVSQWLATAATFHRSCVAQALNRGDGPATCYTFRYCTAKIIFGLAASVL